MEIKTTLGIKKEIDEIYFPNSIDELKDNFNHLTQMHSNVTTVSRGNNWGYGCHAPSKDGGVVINLEKCNAIKEYYDDKGIVTIEPGVSYGQLANFLLENDNKWIAPVHGGGPQCSVVGNVLERGYGITPHMDHFGALISLKAILPNGELYEGSFTNLGLPKLDKIFKYGIGPYYDGLFTQSGVGIVTEATIKLSQKPQYVEMFYFNISKEADFEKTIEAIRISKQEIGSVLGGINLLNLDRTLSMVIDYPENHLQNRRPIPEEDIKKQGKKYFLTPWLVIGMLYGNKKIVKAAKSQIKNNFGKIKKRSIFYNSTNRGIYKNLEKIFSKVGAQNLSYSIKKIDLTYQLLQGQPVDLALQLAFWKHNDKTIKHKKKLNPNKDGAGLIWYAPLVEMSSTKAREYVEFIKKVSKEFQFNPLITLTTIDELCFDSTIPILFNKEDPADVKRARQFYKTILLEGKKLGFFPYRLNIESQLNYDFQTKKFGLELINKHRYA